MENIVEKTPNQIWLEDMGKKPTELTLEDIISYCKLNNKVEWLKATAKKKVTIKVYPRTTYTDENGKNRTKADKSQEPTEKEVPIPFTMLREEFITECMPEVKKPKKPKKLSMYDIIAAL